MEDIMQPGDKVNKTVYGYYSETAAAINGTSIFMTPTGETVVVTTVSEAATPEELFSAYRYSDIQSRGVVTEFVKRGREGTLDQPKLIAFDYPEK